MSLIAEYNIFLFLTLAYWKLTGSLKISAMSEYIYLSLKVPEVSWHAILLSWSMSYSCPIQSVQNPGELLIRMWRVCQNSRFFSALKTDARARDMAQWINTLIMWASMRGWIWIPQSRVKAGCTAWAPREVGSGNEISGKLAGEPPCHMQWQANPQRFCLKQAESKGHHRELSSDLQMHTHIHAH